jgi:16S rRNA (cytosine1402-N4)-methyltransferase
MVREVIDLLRAREGGVFVDATFGGGGHTRAILMANAGNKVLAVDRDGEALESGRVALGTLAARVEFTQMDYRRLPRLLDRRPDLLSGGLVADLGISSLQLLDPERGFGFSRPGPLDMRMDRSTGRTAAELLNSLPERELVRVIAEYGEERYARRIARAIVRRRQDRPLATTTDLAGIVRAAVPGSSAARIDPATRTFQALRIAVNDELSGLSVFVREAAEALRPGARMVFISFHSLEDRPVKQTLRELASPCVCPPGLPVCGCGRKPLVKLLARRARKPSAEEVAENPSARSARLRAAERIAA